VPADTSEETAAEEVETLWKDSDGTVDPTLVVERAETREVLQHDLLRRPLIYRSAVVLFGEEGMTMPAIADIQHIGLPAAKQRLRRGRMMLVTDLAGGDGCMPPSPEAPMRCADAVPECRHRVSETTSTRS